MLIILTATSTAIANTRIQTRRWTCASVSLTARAPPPIRPASTTRSPSPSSSTGGARFGNQYLSHEISLARLRFLPSTRKTLQRLNDRPSGGGDHDGDQRPEESGNWKDGRERPDWCVSERTLPWGFSLAGGTALREVRVEGHCVELLFEAEGSPRKWFTEASRKQRIFAKTKTICLNKSGPIHTVHVCVWTHAHTQTNKQTSTHKHTQWGISHTRFHLLTRNDSPVAEVPAAAICTGDIRVLPVTAVAVDSHLTLVLLG